MGSFVQSCLGANERVIREARIHWIRFFGPVVVISIGAYLVASVDAAGITVVLAGLAFLAVRGLQAATTELAVTDRKVIAKFGVLSRSTIEQQLSKVDSIEIHQGILSRLVGAGSVTVNGSGIKATPIPGIASPLGFRQKVNEAVEKAATPATAS